MQSTGVGVSDEVVNQFNDFKLKRAPYNNRYYIYKINDAGTTIEIESAGDISKSYDDFMGALPPNEPRYGVVDLEFVTDDGRPTSKLVFMSWVPDTSRVKAKMLYAGSKDALKKSLVGVGIHLSATDSSELALDYVLASVKRFA